MVDRTPRHKRVRTRSPEMSPEFVRYSPEIETLDPDLDKLLDQIIEF
jgi:hypothetical protein